MRILYAVLLAGVPTINTFWVMTSGLAWPVQLLLLAAGVGVSAYLILAAMRQAGVQKL